MANSVTYSVVARPNPQNKNEERKWYANAQARGSIDIEEMSERIKNTCTVTKADVYAVLVALEDVIIDELSNGEIVRLHNLGTLQIGLHSKGAMSEKQWSVENIKKANVNFRSGRALEKMLNSLNFTKVAIKYVPVAEEDGEEPPVDNGEDEEI